MKGYTGIAKDATTSTVRVELHAQPKIINVDRARITIVDGSGAARLQSGGTPFTVARTPSRVPGRSSVYGAGSQTPMYGAGSQTPMHDAMDGSRTPHFGSMTPAYTDGGRTPQYNNAWDPSVAATPAR